MVCLLWVLSAASQIDIDVGIAFAIFLALVDPGHLIAVLAILVVVVVTAIVRVALFVQVVEDTRPILFHLDDVLIADSKELDNLSENTPSICINQA